MTPLATACEQQTSMNIGQKKNGKKMAHGGQKVCIIVVVGVTQWGYRESFVTQ
jgi:hypothetical protein